jgi:RNase adaptor protein for sRNA GlmZ degradation
VLLKSSLSKNTKRNRKNKMAKFKDFGSPSSAEKEPVSFKLFEEDFYCVSSLPGKILLDLVTKSSSEVTSDQASIITDFFSSVLLDESLERFNQLIVDKNKVVTTETLAEITGWLVEQYGERPNQQPEV